MTRLRATTFLITVALSSLASSCSPNFQYDTFLSGWADNGSSDNSKVIAEGQAIYSSKCLSCHGPLEVSTKLNRTSTSILLSLTSVPEMRYLTTLTDAEAMALSMALNPNLNRFDPAAAKHHCSASQKNSRGSGSVNGRRLRKDEFVNALASLLGQSVVANLTQLNRFTNDNVTSSVEEFTRNHSLQQVDTIFTTAVEAGIYLSNNRTALNSVAPACVGVAIDSNSLGSQCARDFIVRFGRNAFRRPVSEPEIASFATELADSSTPMGSTTVKEKVAMLIARIILNPKVHFLMDEPDSLEVASTTRRKVDSYTVASRLSFQLTGYPPDEELLQAAEIGELKNLGQVRQQADRLLSSSRGRTHFRSFLRFWLQLDSIAAPDGAPLARFGLINSAANREALRKDAIEELLTFAETIVLDNGGTYTDLMTSNLVFPKSDAIARVLNVSFTPGNSGVASADGRRGLTARPALMMSNLERERPIHRGALLRQRFLCDVIPTQPANVDQIATDNVLSINPLLTSIRDVTNTTTKNSSCAGCHSQFNPLGFVMGGFGALGQRISVEKVFDKSGAQTAQFTPNTSGSSLNVSAPLDSATGDQDLADLVAQSSKGKACIPTMLFRFQKFRSEVSGDSCLLSEAESLIRANQPIRDAIIAAVANEDIFWKGRP